MRGSSFTGVFPYVALAALVLKGPSACALEAQPGPPAAGGDGSMSSGGSAARGGKQGEAGDFADGGTSSGTGGALGGRSSGAGGTPGEAGTTDIGETGGTGGDGAGGSTGGSDGSGGSTGGSTGGSDGSGGSTGGSTGGDRMGGAGGSAGGVGGDAGNAGTGEMPPVCTMCNGDCVYLDTDEENCGACGYACVNGRECLFGRCTPAWQPISQTGAPAPRSGHAAAFVGGRYYVFGGSLTWDGPGVTSGGAYDPATDQWFPIAPLVTARKQHQAVSTGTAIFTFGGFREHLGAFAGGLERFVPSSAQGAWTLITAAGTPAPRYLFGMTWTGSHVMVFGGHDGDLPGIPSGGLFNPTSSTWLDASCALQNCNRVQGVLFPDGNVVRFMGGSFNPDYPVWNGNGTKATNGLSFNPSNGTWSEWTHPEGTGSFGDIIVDDGRRIYFPSGDSVGMYDRATGWLERDKAALPEGMCGSGAAFAWTGTELIGWSGSCATGETSVGGRYQPPAPP